MKFFLSIAGLLILVSIPCQAEDLLIDFIPVITATTQNPLRQIKKLPGDWYITVHFDSPDIDEFRFYGNTIAQDNATMYSIAGDQFLNNFSRVYVDAVVAAYDGNEHVYAVVSLWGPPQYDLGSAYVFKSADQDTPGFDCHYFTDGLGNIQSYYKGWGGTIDCDPITKRRRIGSKVKKIKSSIGKIINENGKWARHLENIRRNNLVKSKSAIDAKVVPSSPLQAVFRAAVQHISKQ